MSIRRFKGIALAAVGCVAAGPVLAASCTGVELRVNSRTSALQATVQSLILSTQATLVATEVAQRQLILSALGVATKQTSSSGNQDAAVRLKAEEAQANAVVASQTRQAVLDAQERYGDVGFKACEVASKGEALAAAFDNQPAMMAEVHDKIVNRPNVSQDGEATKAWFSMMEDGEDTSASVIFDDSSSEEQIAKYIDWLLGPPQSVPQEGAGTIGNAARLQGDAQRSVATYLLEKAAVSKQDGSVDAAIEDLSSVWTGTDGGADWAAKLATSPMRAVLLDMSRAEAANLVAEVVALDHQLDVELGLASLSLARTSQKISEYSSQGGRR